ncbi:MAG TPA: DUF222 domain-containing protein [Jatrophihabitans sp.]|jgi:hypothetical protein
MAQVGFAGAVEALRDAVDGLLDAADLELLPAAELPGLFAKFETQRRRLEAVDHNLLVALDQRGLAGEYGRTSTADLVNELSRVAPGEAKARMRAARDLGPRREVSGALLAPLFARVADAQRDGELSREHARVITTTVAAIPAELTFELAGPVEQFLVDQAKHLDPKQLAAAAHRLIATIDPDGAAPREEDQQRRRGFELAHDRGGWVQVRNGVTEEYHAVWTAILDSLAAPQPGVDGMPDDRTPSQRRHDAMIEAGRRLLRSGTLPDCGGTETTITLALRAEDLDQQTGVAVTESGTTIGWTTAMRLADQCELFTTMFDRHGAVLCAGRSIRTANRAQRRALAARDGGCCFPGCTRPASWCQAHHVIAWIDGGPTDIDNLALVCGFHHREFERQGWLVRIANGVPEWLPPPWIDAQQTPRRNAAHHLPEFDFRTTTGSDARGP